MTDPLRFDDRVVIVTGAGGQPPSLGRTYAHFFAARGAKVLVNDLGTGPDGSGALVANADVVVREIRDAGGEALADTHSVSEPDSAKQIVAAAIEAWGRVDVLVNNAGIVRMGLFGELPDEDCRAIIDSHLYGGLWMSRAAWPHMKAAGYGRVINVCSHSMFGSPYLPEYSAGKSGMYGLTRGMALEGMRYGIQVNTLAPQGRTLKHELLVDDKTTFMQQGLARSVDQVAPVVAFLAHESCDLNGRFIYAGGGKVKEYIVSQTAGYTNPGLTIEDVAANVETVLDPVGAVGVPGPDPAMFDLMAPKRPAPA